MNDLSTLIIQFALAGAVLTGLTVWAKKHKNIFWTFLQHFCGVWFIFSGLVKAVDPIGTAYKMEDYFEAFEQTFEGLTNVFANLAPLFPWLAKYSTGFSITMIVLEIVLGIMLIIGYRRQLTAWLFFLLVVFFTLLTGFTFLTGYVPTEANFFDFAKWGPYLKTQMRVTDCGCFGDFIKLDPKISFFKDCGLMIPALLFLLFFRKMHQLWTPRVREYATFGSIAVFLVMCLQNTYWDLPMVDFRPFKIGADVKQRKAQEEEARGNVEVLGWILENTKTGEKMTFMEPEPGKITYYKQYTKDAGWKVLDQIKNDPFLKIDGKNVPFPSTKVSDFAIEDPQNGEVTEDLLNEEGYSLMIIAYHFEGAEQTETIVVQDTTWATDTIRVNKDSITLQTRVANITPKSIERKVFNPTPAYTEVFKNKVNPLAEAAMQAKWKVYAINTYQDAEKAADLKQKVGATYPFYKGDDKLLKTIIRANPGIVVWKNGVVLGMYHHRHIPTAEALLGKFK